MQSFPRAETNCAHSYYVTRCSANSFFSETASISELALQRVLQIRWAIGLARISGVKEVLHLPKSFGFLPKTADNFMYLIARKMFDRSDRKPQSKTFQDIASFLVLKCRNMFSSNNVVINDAHL